MKLATLLPGYSYESEVGIGQIPVEDKPNFVQYHNKSKVVKKKHFLLVLMYLILTTFLDLCGYNEQGSEMLYSSQIN